MSADTTLLTSAAFPQLLRSPSRMPCSLPRWNQSGAFVGTSRSGAAFPDSQAGRLPRLYFRGLLKLHSRYGLRTCSPDISSGGSFPHR